MGQHPRLEELSHEEWLDSVRMGNLSLLDELYLTHRFEFVKWAKNGFELAEDEAIQYYQQAIMTFYEGIISGNILSIHHDPETYVYDIAKGLILRELRKTHQELEGLDLPLMAMQLPPEDLSYDPIRRRATELMRTLSEPGASILEMFYYHHSKLDQIAKKLKYKSKEVILSQKQLCMNSMKYKIRAQLNASASDETRPLETSSIA